MTGHHLRALACALASAALVAGAVTTGTTSASAATSGGSAVFPGGIAVPPSSTASRQAATYRAAGNASAAAVASRIAAQPTAVWLGDWYSTAQLRSVVAGAVATADRQGKTPVFVTYAIPGRDCGSYSAGGLSASAYRSFSATLASSLAGHRAAVVVEPDALAQLACPGVDATARTALIADQAKRLSAAGASVYLDAGHESWVPASTMASRLRSAGLQYARGFSLNVSNYYSTSGERAYGAQLRALTGKSFVIDTSRNGRGATGQWCNATGAALGSSPQVVNDGTGLDALLWIKAPGESDGTCNGGPSAGAWYAAGAARLVANG
jgi:endoglucanase